MIRRPPRSTLFPYTTLFRSQRRIGQRIKRAPGVELLPIHQKAMGRGDEGESPSHDMATVVHLEIGQGREDFRSEEHTSELQSHSDLVCRLLLEKKKTYDNSVFLNPALGLSEAETQTCQLIFNRRLGGLHGKSPFTNGQNYYTFARVQLNVGHRY